MKEILMFKDGEWVKWDGSDVESLIIKETITLKQLKRFYPKAYANFTLQK